MSILVLQIIIRQWDKSQRTDQHIAERKQLATHYPIVLPSAYYAFNEQCVIDQHGDDIQGQRITYKQDGNGNIIFDRFQVDLQCNTLAFIADPKSKPQISRRLAGLENNWLQCKYNWRYSVYEGGFYYWLYEQITVNAISIDQFDQHIFVNSEPKIIYDDFDLG